jgi:hypothetical protein
MSDHGDEQLPEHDEQESSAPWVTAEKMMALLLASAGVVLLGGLAAGIGEWNNRVQTFADPTDPSALVEQTPDLLARIATALQAFGSVDGLLLVLGFLTLLLLWRHMDDLESAQDGEAPLLPRELVRAAWLSHGVQVVFAVAVVAAVGSIFGWWRSQMGSSWPPLDQFTVLPSLIFPASTVLAAIAGLIGVQSLLRDQRALGATLVSTSSE